MRMAGDRLQAFAAQRQQAAAQGAPPARPSYTPENVRDWAAVGGRVRDAIAQRPAGAQGDAGAPQAGRPAVPQRREVPEGYRNYGQRRSEEAHAANTARRDAPRPDGDREDPRVRGGERREDHRTQAMARRPRMPQQSAPRQPDPRMSGRPQFMPGRVVPQDA